MPGITGYAVTIVLEGDFVTVETMPIEGEDVEYDTLQRAVNGFIERVELGVPAVKGMDGFVVDLWVNEEGLLQDLPLNIVATGLASLLSGLERPLVGNCIITGTDPTGETTPPLSEEQARIITLLLGMVVGRLAT